MPVKLVALAILLAACTHHRPLSALDKLDASTKLTVTTSNNQEVDVTMVRTPRGIVYQTEGGAILDPRSVLRVTETVHSLGAIEGMFVTGGVGAAIGAAIGFADGDDPPCHDWCIFNMTAGEKAAMVGTGLGLIGGVVGLVAGAIRGADVVYDGPESIKITPSGPAGSTAGLTVQF